MGKKFKFYNSSFSEATQPFGMSLVPLESYGTELYDIEDKKYQHGYFDTENQGRTEELYSNWRIVIILLSEYTVAL